MGGRGSAVKINLQLYSECQQTILTLIRLLFKEQSDLGLHCLFYYLYAPNHYFYDYYSTWRSIIVSQQSTRGWHYFHFGGGTCGAGGGGGGAVKINLQLYSECQQTI